MNLGLDAMMREQLMAEVKKLRAGIRVHRDASGATTCAGGTRTCGPCCPSRSMARPLLCPTGRSSCAVA